MAQIETPGGNQGREALRKFANDYNGIGAGRQADSTVWAQAAMRGILAELAATTGNRNDSLNLASFRAGQLVGGGLIERGEAEQRLTEAGQAMGLSSDEVRSTVKSGLSKGVAHPRQPDQTSTRQTAPRPTAPAPTLDQKQADAAAKSAHVLRLAQPAQADHPYLSRKGIAPTSTMLEIPMQLFVGATGWHPKGKSGQLTGDRLLVLPIHQPDENLSSIQLIDEDGRKSFLPGGQIKGGFWASAELPGGDGAGLSIWLGEGMATALSALQATGKGIAVAALSDSNLPTVAMAMRERYPAAEIALLADLLPDGAPNRHAVHAAQAVNGMLAVPRFNSGENGKDINDFHQLNGLEATKQLIEAATAPAAPEQAGQTAPTKPATYSMRELMTRNFEDVQFIVDELLPQGVFILGGKPKVGKSWLALHLLLSVSYGLPVFGTLATDQGRCLYLSLEDHDRRLWKRVRQVCRQIPTDDLHFTTQWSRIGQGCAEDLDKWLADNPETKMVVVDTLARVKPPRGRNADLYAEDYAAVASFKELSERHGIAVILIHHLRKMGSDDPADMLSGTTGLAGGVDGTLILTKKAGSETLTLHRSGRDLVDDEPLTLKWDREAGVWLSLDKASASAAEISEGQQQILDTLKSHGYSMSCADIAAATSGNAENVRKTLYRMVDRGILIKNGPSNSPRYSINASTQNIGVQPEDGNKARYQNPRPPHPPHPHVSTPSTPSTPSKNGGVDGGYTDVDVQTSTQRPPLAGNNFNELDTGWTGWTGWTPHMQSDIPDGEDF
ncbi:MAG: AAA family ATPase [Magnetococcales bacterium]|nr:AAA family ATPase [Magnetococcales bacterium]